MNTDIVIVGAGFAGAATAYHLSQGFEGSILILDQEEVPGFHASGRNASLLLSSVENREVREIVARSSRAYQERKEEVGFREVGSLLLGSPHQLEAVREPELVASEILSPDEARARVPLLEGHSFAAALMTPADGVIDISQLLQFYLADARNNGARLALKEKVESIEKTGRGFRVTTTRGVIETNILVNAAGAWAPSVAEAAGASPLPMRSFKRHLFVLEDIPRLEASWPFVWSLEKNFYFRPESGGLLFSICDEELAKGEFVQTVNPGLSEDLADLIAAELPLLEDSLQRRVWSCFRTKTPHGGFHLGWDAALEGFFWVAGLGGHGMGASWEIGKRAADQLTIGSFGRR